MNIKNKKLKIQLCLIGVLAVVLCALVLLAVHLSQTRQSAAPAPTEGEKTPDRYTWEEYQTLSPQEQDQVYEWFGSADAFEAWMEEARPDATAPDFTWDKPGKTPDAYTWEEYQALTREEQEGFYGWFESAGAFEAWLEGAKPADATAPALKPEKQPEDYTWQEYQAMSPQEQDAFYQLFGSLDAFEAWLEKVKPADTAAPELTWNKPGKTPDAYTWEEYQTLSNLEKDAFYRWFGSEAAFETWLEAARPDAIAPDFTWDKPGKTPEDYTWEEYQALSALEQEAFYRWFGSKSAFEAWQKKAKPSGTEPAVSWTKQPDAYTWEEYQALSPQEQDAFFQWFGSLEDFEAWMDRVCPEETP